MEDEIRHLHFDFWQSEEAQFSLMVQDYYKKKGMRKIVLERYFNHLLRFLAGCTPLNLLVLFPSFAGRHLY